MRYMCGYLTYSINEIEYLTKQICQFILSCVPNVNGSTTFFPVCHQLLVVTTAIIETYMYVFAVIITMLHLCSGLKVL